MRESEERFRGTFENAPVGIVHNDNAGRFLRVNGTYCAIVGYSRVELVQKTLPDIIHPEDLAAHVELYESCFTRGESPAFFTKEVLDAQGRLGGLGRSLQPARAATRRAGPCTP